MCPAVSFRCSDCSLVSSAQHLRAQIRGGGARLNTEPIHNLFCFGVWRENRPPCRMPPARANAVGKQKCYTPLTEPRKKLMRFS